MSGAKGKTEVLRRSVLLEAQASDRVKTKAGLNLVYGGGSENLDSDSLVLAMARCRENGLVKLSHNVAECISSDGFLALYRCAWLTADKAVLPRRRLHGFTAARSTQHDV